MIYRMLMFGTAVLLLTLSTGSVLAAGCCQRNASCPGSLFYSAAWPTRGVSGAPQAASCCSPGTTPASTYGPPTSMRTALVPASTVLAANPERPMTVPAEQRRKVKGPVKNPYSPVSYDGPAAPRTSWPLRVQAQAPATESLPACCQGTLKPAAGQEDAIPGLSALLNGTVKGATGAAQVDVKTAKERPAVQVVAAGPQGSNAWSKPALSSDEGSMRVPDKPASAPSCCTTDGIPVKPLKIGESPTGSYFNAPRGCGRVNCSGACSRWGGIDAKVFMR